MNSSLTQIISTYLAGITGIYKGIPVGFALNTNPVLIALFTALGSISIVVLIYYSGQPFKKWIILRLGKNRLEKKQGLFTRIMNRYGIIGIGIIAPGIIGPIGAIILGLIVLKETKFFLLYLITGIILWSTALTLVGYYSIDLLKKFL